MNYSMMRNITNNSHSSLYSRWILGYLTVGIYYVHNIVGWPRPESPQPVMNGYVQWILVGAYLPPHSFGPPLYLVLALGDALVHFTLADVVFIYITRPPPCMKSRIRHSPSRPPLLPCKESNWRNLVQLAPGVLLRFCLCPPSLARFWTFHSTGDVSLSRLGTLNVVMCCSLYIPIIAEVVKSQTGLIKKGYRTEIVEGLIYYSATGPSDLRE